MKSFAKHYKLTIILGAIAAAVAVGYYMLFQSLFSEIAETTATINEVRAEQRNHDMLESNRRAVVELQDDLGTIDSFFVTADGVVDFIESVETLATNQSLSIDVRNVSLERVTNSSRSSLLEELHLRIETRGSWQDSYNFLTQLEHLPYNISVSLAGVEKLDGVDGANWRGSFDLAVLKLI